MVAQDLMALQLAPDREAAAELHMQHSRVLVATAAYRVVEAAAEVPHLRVGSLVTVAPVPEAKSG
jgi:hypothetical protein